MLRFDPTISGRRAASLLLGAFLAVAEVSAAESLPTAVTARPLSARSGPRGATLFATLTPEQTGLHALNRYDDPRMWAERYREFSLGAIGTGVAAGDYDGDGRPDLFVATKTGPCRLFRNLGGCRFEDVTERTGVAGPADAWQQGVAMADIDGDADLDLYVCRFGAPNLLFVNQGDGTFREEAAARGLALNDASSMAAFADYDRDGDLDVFVQTNVLDTERRPNGQRDRLFRNEGGGMFLDVTDRAGLSGETQGHSATWWDFDEDGWPDVYVANDFKDPDQLYRNNRDGTFTNVLSQVVPHTPHSSMGADLGDVNGDGHLDLLVADMAATTREKDHRGMAKVRSGLTDDEQRPHAAPQLMRNALLLNTGTGVMREGACLAGLDATDWTWSVRLEDLDDDGRLDAHFTNGMVRELHNADVVERMMTKESLGERTRIMKASPVLAERNLAFRSAGAGAADLNFENVSAAWGLDHDGVHFGAAFADFDGDGDLDLVFSGLDAELTFCRNDNDRGARAMLELRGRANRQGVGAVIRVTAGGATQTRTLVLARGYLSGSEPLIHLGLGAATKIDRLEVQWPGGAVQAFDDLPVGQRLTIEEPEPVVRSPTAPATSVRPVTHAIAPRFRSVERERGLAIEQREKPATARLKQPMLPFRFGRGGPGAAFGDLDGDGEDDLCLAGTEGEKARLLQNLGDGNFLALGILPGANNVVGDAVPLIFEVNGDGKPDLLLTKGGDSRPAGDPAYRPALWLNDGAGRLRAAPPDNLPDFTGSVGATVAADFNRDGRLDVFLGARMVPARYPEIPDSALWFNRDGRFENAPEAWSAPVRRIGLVTAAVARDFDNDGWTDLLVATEWGMVRCLHNQEGRGFEDVTEGRGFGAVGRGWWSSLCCGDFNGDGRPDFVAGNVGRNTPYRATREEPIELLAGDLDGRGTFSVLEVWSEGGRRFPRRGLPQFAAALPPLGRKFTSFDAFARATLEDLLPAERLATATRLHADELRSGVFLSQPDGNYRFSPLPAEVQLAPVFGASAADFDGDGCADLLLVQNSYAPLPEVGRFAGGVGVWLRGDGRGALTAVPTLESGFVARHDAKALALTDLDRDGWPDVFVTRNNDSSLAWLAARNPGHRSIGVVLRGPPTNPSAIGAVVQVSLRDGRTQRAEVAAGCGYRSQSSATVWFGFADENPPNEFTVRWPDGRRSTHPWSPSAVKVVLVPPAP